MSGTIKKVSRAGGDVFQAYGRRDGKKVYIGSRPTEQEARELLEEHRVTVRQIARGELPPQVDRKRTLGTAVDLWLRQYKKRSKELYRKRFDRYIAGPLGGVPLVQVTSTMVEDLQSTLLARLDPATVNAAIRVLSSAFTYFTKVKKWVRENPCSAVPLLEERARGYNWIKSRDEQERLLAHCKEPLQPMVAVLLMTGMRLEEMTHLHWTDIDLTLRQITIQRGRSGTTKSGKIRIIPINNSLLPVLKAWRLKAGAGDLAFPGREGEVRHPSSVRVPFKRALVRAKLDPSLRVHDCRHTYASTYLREGGSIFRLSRYLGHSSVKITEKVYAHMVPADFEQDWDRNCLRVPTEPARVIQLVPGDKRETGSDAADSDAATA